MSSTTTTSTIELQLLPAPGQKPEFLATLEPASTVGSTSSLWSKLTTTTTTAGTAVAPENNSSSSSSSPLQRVVLEGYTRDAWAMSFPSNGSIISTNSVWQNLSVRSIDGRNKLPGFVKYLQQRNKVAYGRFEHAAAGSDGGGNDTSSSTKNTGVWIVPPQKQSSNNTEVMSCWICMDIRKIQNCTLITTNNNDNKINKNHSAAEPPPKATTEKESSSKRQPLPATATKNKTATKTTTTTTSSNNNKRGGGLLGNLVGAQKRTNEHLSNAPAKKPVHVVDHDGDDPNALHSTSTTSKNHPHQHRTVTQVLDDFRQSIEQKLLDFDAEEHETVLEIPIRYAEPIQGLNTQEERDKVSMEVLKYLIQEQAEEINEEWVVHQPPSEFLDEITLTIYKEAPPDILEEMNQGILPEEVRQQQRAIQSERQKAVNQAEAKRQAELRAMALRKASQEDDDDDDDNNDALARLNTNKRDRRTVEDYQREAAAQQQSKKGNRRDYCVPL